MLTTITLEWNGMKNGNCKPHKYNEHKKLLPTVTPSAASLVQAEGAAHPEAISLEDVDERLRREQQLSAAHVRPEPGTGPQQTLPGRRRHCTAL